MIYLLLVSIMLVTSMSTTTNLTETIQNCNDCHEPTAAGHVGYSFTLSGNTTVNSGELINLTGMLKNNGYPLTNVQISLVFNNDSGIVNESAITVDIGNLDRGSIFTVHWIFKFQTEKSQAQIDVQFTSRAFASSHMQYDYNQTYQFNYDIISSSTSNSSENNSEIISTAGYSNMFVLGVILLSIVRLKKKKI